MEKILFGNDKNIEKNGFVWNAAYGMIMAFQSVVLLMIIKRICGLTAAGVFGIANAIANLMFAIGRYGMRNYQVSDVKGQYSFFDYLWSRIITCVIMILVSIGYAFSAILTSGYNMDKVVIIILYCFLKTVDAFEDVYIGYYQQRGRLDVGGRFSSLRLMASLVVMAVVLFVSKSLMLAILIALIVSVILSAYFISVTYRKIGEGGFLKTSEVRKVISLLVSVFPLFIGAYLALYIDNVEKYAIDKYMDESAQACYNFIFMPVFVVSLLSSFIFQPLVDGISKMWLDKELNKFKASIFKQLGVIFVITVIVLLGAYLLGIPVLSIIYATDLGMYKNELMVLLIGGTFYAVGVLFTIILTIMRHQGAVISGYLVTAILAKAFSKTTVQTNGIMGASVLYTASMLVGVIVFMVFILVYYIKRKKH